MKRMLFAALCCSSLTAFAADTTATPPKPATPGTMPAAPAGSATGSAMPGTKATPPMATTPPGTTTAGASFTPRKVTKQDTKGIEAMLAAQEAAYMKGDIEMAATHVDFPIVMLTDNQQGVVSTGNWDKKKFMDEMSAAMQNMPKDMKMKHKRKYYFLTDTIALVMDDMSATMGKTNLAWHSASTVVMKDGKWMMKQMMEGGWGDAPGMKADATMPMPTTPSTMPKKSDMSTATGAR